MRLQLGGGFEWVDTPGGRALVCRPLEPFAAHFFTTRGWALGSGSADGWQSVAAALEIPRQRLVRVRQVHGDRVLVVRAHGDEGSELTEADIITTDDSTIGAAIQTADCVPLLLADRRSGAVAAAHAGWRGLAAGVPRVAVTAMAHAFGSQPAYVVAAIGPSISAARYEVGEDVRASFEASGEPADRVAAWFPAQTRPGHWLFDGWSAAADQLEAAGVPAASIHRSAACTASFPDLFCSYRRDGQRAGRMAAAIRRRSKSIG